MEQGSLLRAIRHFWKLEVLIVVVLFALTAVPALRAPARYRTTTTISISPSAPLGESLGSTGLIEFELPAVAQQVRGRTFADGVRADLGLPASRSWSAIAGFDKRGGVMRVIVESGDRALVLPVANAYASRLVRRIPEERELRVVTLQRATSIAKVAPAPVKAVVTGLSLGLIVALTTAVLIDPITRDRRRRRADELVPATA